MWSVLVYNILKILRTLHAIREPQKGANERTKEAAKVNVQGWGKEVKKRATGGSRGNVRKFPPPPGEFFQVQPTILNPESDIFQKKVTLLLIEL